MEQRTEPAKVIPLDANRQRAVFWYSIVVMLCLAGAAIGVSMLLAATQKSLDQVKDLSERVERAAADRSPSEPPKT